MAPSYHNSPLPILQVEGFNKTYGTVKAVENLSFHINPGEILGILGPNGAGKTTTIEGILALRAIDSGKVRLFGKNPFQEPTAVKQSVGVQLQSLSLPDAMTPAQAIQLASAFYKTTKQPSQLFADFGLEEVSQRPFSKLSQGQKQRLSLALAFVHNPILHILDEPTAGLDPDTRHQFHTILQKTKQEGNSVLLSTHLIDEAEHLCDRIIVLFQGKRIAEGTPAQLIVQTSQESEISIEIEEDSPPLTDKILLELEEICPFKSGEQKLLFQTTKPDVLLLPILGKLQDIGLLIKRVDIRKPNLTAAYLKLVERFQKDPSSELPTE